VGVATDTATTAAAGLLVAMVMLLEQSVWDGVGAEARYFLRIPYILAAVDVK